MTIQNKHSLKRYTYICLSASSIMLSSEVSAVDFSEDETRYPVNSKYTLLPKLGKNVGDTLEGGNLVGPSSKIFKHPKDEMEKDLKKMPSGGKELRKKARETAKSVAKEVAQKAAYEFLKDEKEAKNIALSIIKGSHLKKKKDPNEERFLHLAQNYAMNKARIAAKEVAYDLLKDEKEALKIVKSLNFYKYAKKENRNGGKVLKTSPAISKLKTLQDLKQEIRENRFSKKKGGSPSLDGAKKEIKIKKSIFPKILKAGLGIADFIMKLIK